VLRATDRDLDTLVAGWVDEMSSFLIEAWNLEDEIMIEFSCVALQSCEEMMTALRETDR
jgi:hypothetical protein